MDIAQHCHFLVISYSIGGGGDGNYSANVRDDPFQLNIVYNVNSMRDRAAATVARAAPPPHRHVAKRG